MQRYSITRVLNLPGYKITGIMSETDEEIDMRLEPYKRKRAKCGRCGIEHKSGIAKKKLLCETSQ